jgi:hypothetical protein
VQSRIVGRGPWGQLIASRVIGFSKISKILVSKDQPIDDLYTASKSNFLDTPIDTMFFLCGPPNVNWEMLKSLVELGFQKIWVEKIFINDVDELNDLARYNTKTQIYFNYTHAYDPVVEKIGNRLILPKQQVNFYWKKYTKNYDLLHNLAVHDLAILLKLRGIGSNCLVTMASAKKGEYLKFQIDNEGTEFNFSYEISKTSKEKSVGFSTGDKLFFGSPVAGSDPLQKSLDHFISKPNHSFDENFQKHLMILVLKIKSLID